MAEAGFFHQRLVVVRFFRRQIQNQQAVHAGLRGVGDEFFQPDLVNQIEINVEDDRESAIACGWRQRFPKLSAAWCRIPGRAARQAGSPDRRPADR